MDSPIEIQTIVTPEHFNILFSNNKSIDVKSFKLSDDSISMINMRGDIDIRKLTPSYHIIYICKIPVDVKFFTKGSINERNT